MSPPLHLGSAGELQAKVSSKFWALSEHRDLREGIAYVDVQTL